MSGYDYAGRSGYAVHTSKPVSVVSYDGRGTRTYVTRIEERVEQVRRPSTMGYVYSSAVKAEKESRPREVDDFINKILDEVNGSSVTTTTWSDGGRDHKFGTNPRSYYEVEYVSVGTGTRIPRNYGDPYDLKELSSHLYDNNPSKMFYGGRDYPSDNSRVKSETQRNYEVPKTRLERSSHPSYDASPYVPPPVESRAPRTYEAYPDNRLKSDRKDYEIPDKRWVDSSPEYEYPPRKEILHGAPNDRWGNPPMKHSYDQKLPSIDRQQGEFSSVKPQSSKGYRVSDSQGQGGRSSSPNHSPLPRKVLGEGSKNPSNYPSDNSHVKSETQRNYEVPKTGLERSSHPSYDASPYGPPPVESRAPRTYEVYPDNRLKSDRKGYEIPDQRWVDSSSEYEHPPRKEILHGAPNDRWGNPPMKQSYDQKLPSNDRQQGEFSSVKPQSPKSYGVSDSQGQGGRSSSPNHSPLQRKVLGEGSKNLSNSPLKPTFDQTPSNDNIGGPSYGRQSSPSVQLQSPTNYGSPGNQRDGSTSPDFELPPRNDIMSRVPNNQWSNPPMEAPKSIGHNYDGRRSNSPEKFGSSGGYQVPENQKGRSTSPAYEHPPRHEIITPKVQIPQDRKSPSPNGNVDGALNNRWNNIPVKTQSPRDYGAHGNQLSGPSSPFGDSSTNDSRPNNIRGSDQAKSPLSQTASSGVSLQPKYSVY